jgi:hypothetical protein
LQHSFASLECKSVTSSERSAGYAHCCKPREKPLGPARSLTGYHGHMACL